MDRSSLTSVLLATHTPGMEIVGKTALLHEVVRRMEADEVPEGLAGCEAWFLTANHLVARMKYIGEW